MPDNKLRKIKALEQQKKLLEEKIRALKKELSEQKRENRALVKGTRLLRASDNFIKTARAIFNYTKELTGARAGYIALLNKEKMENEVVFLEPGNFQCTVPENLPMPIRGLRAEAYQSGQTVYDNRYQKNPHRKYMPQGHIPLHRVMFVPIKIGGETIGIMGLGEKETDFTERDKHIASILAEFVAVALLNSRTVEALKKSEAQLNKMNETKDKFLSLIAHDLRNPLAAMNISSELIMRAIEKKDISHEKMIEFAKIISESTIHARKLLDNLLKWSTSQFDSLNFIPVNLNVAKAIQESIKPLEALAINKNIKILVQIPENLMIKADNDMFETIIRNLVSNAIKFTRPSGKVTIRAFSNNGNVTISVKDNGIGIPKHVQKKLFRIDKRHSSPGTFNERGTGLGLILCKEFVEKHQGNISVKSVYGKGSEFIITLPAE